MFSIPAGGQTSVKNCRSLRCSARIKEETVRNQRDKVSVTVAAQVDRLSDLFEVYGCTFTRFWQKRLDPLRCV